MKRVKTAKLGAFVSLFDEAALDQRAKTLGQPKALALASTWESA